MKSKRDQLPFGDIEFDVPEILRPSVERALRQKPGIDALVDALARPDKVGPNGLAVLALRLYRRVRPTSIGNRCVFEPSCSRYAELAFRQHTFLKAGKLTLQRLLRCRHGNGGIDLTELEHPE